MKEKDLAYQPHIDGLRALAVLSVVINHLTPRWLPGGFIGVDIFFVISGYLISSKIFYELRMGNFQFSDFYWRRAKRLIPALTVVLVAVLLLAWFVLYPLEYESLARHSVGGIAFISNFIMMREAGYFDDAAITKPLMHLWSLGVEEQYYLVFPVLIGALWVAPRLRKDLLTVLVLLALASFYCSLHQNYYNPSAAYYSPVNRAWEFLLGAIYAHIKAVPPLSCASGASSQFQSAIAKCLNSFVIVGNRTSLLGLAVLGLALCVTKPSDSFLGVLTILPVLATVWLIADQKSGVVKYVFENKWSVLLGKISYPLYLWHWPLISFASYLGLNERTDKVVILITSLLLAYLTWRYIEVPTNRAFAGIATRPKVKAVLVFSMAGVVVLGGLIIFFDGIEERHISKYAHNQKDLIRTYPTDDSCTSKLDVKIDYCRGGLSADEDTIAIIGDSHAHAAFPGIEAFLNKHGKKAILLANSGCPPFLGAEYGRNQNEKEKCREKIEAIYNLVLSSKSIKTIFIFTRGAAYIEPVIAVSGEQIPPLIRPDRFLSAMSETTSNFAAAGKTVYYVIENPTLRFYPGECLPRPLAYSKKDCSENLAKVLDQQRLYRKVLQGVSNLILIDPVDVFCPKGNCLTESNGRILYADQNHLSVWGSEFQAQKTLAPYLR
jgi:peptidoglycan/LPS O-acetylase OafA/YrhL